MIAQRQRILEIIENLPDEALDELEEDVIGLREFYESRVNYKPPSAPKPKSYPVKYNPPEIRPVFPIGDDDD